MSFHTTVQESEYYGAAPANVGVTNGSGRVGFMITDGLLPSRKEFVIALEPRQAAEIGRALLNGALNVVEKKWGGETDSDIRAIAALNSSAIWEGEGE